MAKGRLFNIIPKHLFGGITPKLQCVHIGSCSIPFRSSILINLVHLHLDCSSTLSPSGLAKSWLFEFLMGTSFLSCYIWAIWSVIIYTRPTLHFFDKRKWTTANCRSWSMILTLALQRMSQNVTPRQGLENMSRLVTLLRARYCISWNSCSSSLNIPKRGI